MSEELVCLKQELKCWESMFKRKFGRKPTKEDIDGTSPEIKDSYKKYAILKKQQKKVGEDNQNITKQSLDDDDVFGNSLNKAHNKSSIEKMEVFNEDNEIWVPPKIKTASRNLPSKKQQKKIDEFKENNVIEENNGDDNQVMTYQISSHQHMTKNIKNIKSRLSLKSSPSLNNHNRRTFSRLSQEFLTQCKKEVPLRELDRPFESNFDDDAANVEVSNHAEYDVSLHLSDNINSNTEASEAMTIPSNVINTTCDKADVESTAEASAKNLCEEKSLVNTLVERKECSEIHLTSHREDIPLEQTVENMDENCNDVTSMPSEKEKKLKKKKPTKRKKVSDNHTAGENDTKSKKVKLTKTEAAKVKRLVSDNFVKIDLRKKTYQRGVSKVSASAMKRKYWRRKTSFELPTKTAKSSWGMKKVCFRCGGEGHWAKFCKGPAKKKNPFNSIDEEKNSIEFENLESSKGSCFEHLTDVADAITNSITHRNVFTKNDILDIEPVWPRHPIKKELAPCDVDILFQPNDIQPTQECCDCVQDYLKVFGYETFREGQREAMTRVCSGLSTLVVLATGSGKSLCYQLPAYIYFKEKGYMTIVVSPLVALMQDQVANLPSFLPGAFLNSSMTKLQQKRTIDKIKEGKIAVLLVSPETLVSGGFGTGILPPKSSLPPLAFACIDEAHCLSEWSHNFRPSYLKVCKVLREKYNIQCLLGLTATASQTTATSVVHHLGIPNHPGSIIRDPKPIPENLQLSASRDNNRDQALVELLQMKPFIDCNSIIVYVTRRDDTERLASLLRTSLPERNCERSKEKHANSKEKKEKKPGWWMAEAYHAGLTPAQRKRIQKTFMAGELRIVVATVAFGMGLDKSDVRSVIHYNMPKSFENYVQEIGRAGRDGKPSYCHVFIDDGVDDLNEIKRHIYGNTVDNRTIRKFVDTIFPLCDCRQLHEKYKEKDFFCGGESLEDDELDLYFFQYGGDAAVNSSDIIPDDVSNRMDNTSDVRTCNETKRLPQMNNNKESENQSQFYCSGHRFSMGVDEFVSSLDVPEENIATLMSYLELHDERYIEILNPIRARCSLKCYGGPLQFQLLAKKFPPVALTLRTLGCDELQSLDSMREIDLNVCEIADKMCWDVLAVLREVRSLQWNMTYAIDGPLNNTGKSGIIVESGKVEFHVITAENISDDVLDTICEYLIKAVNNQEETRLLQLDALYNVLRQLSCANYYQLPLNKRIDGQARKHINAYFLSNHAEQLELLKKLRIVNTCCETSQRRWNSIASDVRSLMNTYPDQNLTGRCMAKIFQGISSPNYPAIIYGRDKRFWRQYIDVGFNELRVFCAEQIINLKR